ncbi:MAG: hypothetical protein BWY82_02349 [Verrucomicrobia bacterium ADurb.Bin474]|nr:MAG: hypothetical protein BWY82_02349 [Verrucomicrobia bacterium ADurb.Bin474]
MRCPTQTECSGIFNRLLFNLQLVFSLEMPESNMRWRWPLAQLAFIILRFFAAHWITIGRCSIHRAEIG